MQFLKGFHDVLSISRLAPDEADEQSEEDEDGEGGEGERPGIGLHVWGLGVEMTYVLGVGAMQEMSLFGGGCVGLAFLFLLWGGLLLIVLAPC